MHWYFSPGGRSIVTALIVSVVVAFRRRSLTMRGAFWSAFPALSPLASLGWEATIVTLKGGGGQRFTWQADVLTVLLYISIPMAAFAI